MAPLHCEPRRGTVTHSIAIHQRIRILGGEAIVPPTPGDQRRCDKRGAHRIRSDEHADPSPAAGVAATVSAWRSICLSTACATGAAVCRNADAEKPGDGYRRGEIGGFVVAEEEAKAEVGSMDQEAIIHGRDVVGFILLQRGCMH